VGAYFTSEETGYYTSAGTLSRALVWIVGPLTAVMFPKIVHSVAKAEKTDLLAVTLLCTVVLAGGGALGLWLVAPWVIKLVFKSSFLKVAMEVIPWYAGAMVPLSLANVLVNNLLARGQFRVVPWLVLLALAYALALTRFHGSLVMVLQTLAVFCLLALALCAWFTWGPPSRSPKSEVRS
jgi:O-antigen/teichoic acid export membrane protein